MNDTGTVAGLESTRDIIAAVYRSESRRVLATLIRLLGDFDAAEEALQQAFAVALEQWPQQGVPANPRAWLVSAGKFKAIDGIRRNARWRAARTSSDGEPVLMDAQDRALCDRDLIAEGGALVEQALTSRRFGPYTLQAAISAVHAESPSAADTDWAQIVGLYDVLLRVEPSAVIELNRAVAVAIRYGPASGLRLIEAILTRGELADYRLAHAARADLHRRLGQVNEARAAYERALALTQTAPERRFLKRRLSEL